MKDFFLTCAAATCVMLTGYVVGRAEIPEPAKPAPAALHQAFLNGMDAEADGNPIRVVGYGCEGVTNGVLWAAEEDQLPKCDQVLAVGQRDDNGTALAHAD